MKTLYIRKHEFQGGEIEADHYLIDDDLDIMEAYGKWKELDKELKRQKGDRIDFGSWLYEQGLAKEPDVKNTVYFEPDTERLKIDGVWVNR